MLTLKAGLLIVLLLLTAFLAGTDAAVRALTRAARPLRQDDLSERARMLLQRPRATLFTVLILSTLSRLGVVTLAVLLLIDTALLTGWNPSLVLLIGLAVLAVVLIALVEIGPRFPATRRADAYCHRASFLLLPLHRLLERLVVYLDQRLGTAQRHLRSTLAPAASDSAEAAASADGHPFGADEDELVTSIAEFSEMTVREVMVSRMDIVALPVSATLPEALEIIRESGYSRLPLYVQHLDNILGIVYTKDLLPYLIDGVKTSGTFDWMRIARPAMFVPLDKRLDALLRDFQARKTHMAIVVDEYGGTAGLVTMENVLEEIVGDIRDEHDEEEEEECVQIDAHTYSVDARMNLDDLSDLLEIPLNTEDFDFETLGGLILHLTGTVPSEGDVIDYPPLHMTVETVDNHRIGRVRVQIDVPTEEIPEDEPAPRA